MWHSCYFTRNLKHFAGNFYWRKNKSSVFKPLHSHAPMVFFIHPAPVFTLDLLLEANSVGTEQISWANKAIQINTPGNVPFSHSSAPTWGSLCQHFASKIIGAGYEHHPVVIQMREGELGGGGGLAAPLSKTITFIAWPRLKSCHKLSHGTRPAGEVNHILPTNHSAQTLPITMVPSSPIRRQH